MDTRSPLGVQLYSVKDHLAPSVLQGTLRRLAEMGYTHAEPYDIVSSTHSLREALDESGLLARTAHARVFQLDRETVFSAAGALGVDTVIVPWVEPASVRHADGVGDLARRMNELSSFAADRGIRIGYHNHDFEFSQHIEDGRSAFEALVSLLDPDIVLQVDTYWASVGGADVFELLPRLRDRVRLLHVKNEPPEPNDPPLLGVDVTGQMDFIVRSTRDFVEMPVVEVVVDDGDIFEVLARNAAFFSQVQA